MSFLLKELLKELELKAFLANSCPKTSCSPEGVGVRIWDLI